MIITIGKMRLKQVDGSSIDDIIFKDIDTEKEYSFDEYLELTKKEKL